MKIRHTYTLSLHWKQGDEIADHVKRARSASGAFEAWRDDYAKRQQVCDRISKILEGKRVSVHGDNHMITLEARTDDAEEALAELCKEGILSLLEELMDFESGEN